MYGLEGPDAPVFDFDPERGQILLSDRVTLNFAAQQTYVVTVTVTDGNGGETEVDVQIAVIPRSIPQVVRRGGGGGGGGRPAPEPDLPEISYSLEVVDNDAVQAPGNPDLQHNTPWLRATFPDGTTRESDYLGHYRNTGGLIRWGYPTSEVLFLEDGTLTQFYQRGVADLHDLGSGWIVERRLAWDYAGGGLGNAPDMGTEPGITNPNPGTQFGPWGHKVSDIAVVGTEVGFARFFDELGGVASFGLPKTDARADNR